MRKFHRRINKEIKEMDSEQLKKLFQEYKTGKITIQDALEQLKFLPFESLDFARIDHHRMLRQGFPEVIFCEGKTVKQVVSISERIIAQGHNLIGTRAFQEQYEGVKEKFPAAKYHPEARTITFVTKKIKRHRTRKSILVISAGTSDIPVAEEAAIVSEMMGNRVDRIFDIGVAGIHRLLNYFDMLNKAGVIIIVAGMEGALASVVGGIVDKPIIAVPTSVGYGASFGGIAALLGMLNSCSGGVTVVNIDNGFGAAYAANAIMRMISK